VLVFGGDEVYPTPSRENYQKRLIAPFESAFGDDHPQERPHVFAIPGNHDWYDSLTSFIRLFCSDLSKRRFGGWRTRQHRSYFALKLPQNWWLLGSDGQLHSDLDTPQIEYFRFIADNHMKEGDRVILCVAEPVWIYAHKYEKFGATYNETDLLFLEHEILSKKNVQIKVFLSGDLHHYRRHEERDPRNSESKTQKITAGGGGAFMMGTHGMDFSVIAEETELPHTKPRTFVLKESYPEPSISRRLSFRNLLFPFINPWFGILPGMLYMLTVWSVWAAIGTQSPHGTFQSLVFTMIALRNDPALALWLAFVVGGFVFFTDTHSRVYKWAGGFAHAFAHYFCLFHIGWGVTILCNMLIRTHPIMNFVVGAILVFGAGWWVGSFVVGIYLLISLNVFGRHDQEAFSALKIQDYKNFLRMHIAADGSLTIYPIKLEKIPRRWRHRRKDEETKTNSLLVPVGGSQPELIESPIVLKG